ncbi:MAG: YfiR family protein [Planctomycetes bacterium]|nr:YfiR family protein [Planctomycetota bacterium]
MAQAAGAQGTIDARDELAVKSAFVFNFAARHVKWPEAAFKDKSAPFVIGVLGRDPIAAVLTETCKGRKSGERPIEVRVVEPDVAGDCQLLFVPAGREAEVPALAQTLKDRPVLLVAESEAAVQRGAHLGFFLANSRVRFAAHPASAKQAGLEVSSELLKLARVVERRAEDQP